MAIISVSGYMGSGKDLVTKIIQYIYYKENINSNIDDFINIYKDDNYFNEIISMTSWENKKWADALKEVCSILTGIPRPDFEKIEVKNSYWNPSSGFVYLQKEIPNNGIKIDNIESYIYEIIKNKKNNVYILIRIILQYFGTEVGRHTIGDYVWVNALMSKYKIKEEVIYSSDGISSYNDYPNWIISDTRFYNELNAVKSRNGICIRVNRDDNQTTSTHPSERELDDAKFDYVIQNNTGEIQKLIYDVREILIKEKLL